MQPALLALAYCLCNVPSQHVSDACFGVEGFVMLLSRETSFQAPVCDASGRACDAVPMLQLRFYIRQQLWVLVRGVQAVLLAVNADPWLPGASPQHDGAVCTHTAWSVTNLPGGWCGIWQRSCLALLPSCGALRSHEDSLHECHLASKHSCIYLTMWFVCTEAQQALDAKSCQPGRVCSTVHT